MSESVRVEQEEASTAMSSKEAHTLLAFNDAAGALNVDLEESAP